MAWFGRSVRRTAVRAPPVHADPRDGYGERNRSRGHGAFTGTRGIVRGANGVGEMQSDKRGSSTSKWTLMTGSWGVYSRKLLRRSSGVVAMFILAAATIVTPSVASAATTTTVLINGDTLASFATVNESTIATGLGYTVTVVSGSTWDSMTAAQFAAYNVLVIGDPACGDLAPSVTSNESVWAPVVMGTSVHTQAGNRVLIGTDPVYHGFYNALTGPPHLISAGLQYAATTPSGTTGLYFDASCSGPYGNIATNGVLDQLTSSGAGSWTEDTSPPCGGNVSLIASNPSFAGLSSGDLAGWECSVHESFPAYPSDWTPLAIATDTTSHPVCGTDVSTGAAACGEAYVLVAGTDLVVTAPNLSVSPTTGSDTAGGTHSVTATVVTGGSPTSGQLVTFTLTGQNAGVSGTCAPVTCVTDDDGNVVFTYTDVNGAGTDTIAASFTTSGGSREQATAAETWTAILPADQTITATVSSSSTPWSNTVTVGSTGSSGTGAITFNLDPSSDAVCHLSGTTLSATGAGTCYVSASIAADANYTGATSALVPVTFTAADQTITATVSSSSTPWSNTVTVGSTGSSGTGAITFNLDPASDAVCHLSGTTLPATGAGTCYVSASIAADANYTGATSALVPVTFTAADQTITATVSSSSTPWSNTVTVGSTGSSGTGAITFNLDPSSDAVCHLSGTTLSATGAGTCYVSASIAADANYTGATSALVPVTFTAGDQTITATVSSSSTPWSNTVTVGSTGSSGTGAITFNLDPSSDAVCHLSGTTLSATGAGTCYVSASIAADANYTGATSALVPVTFTAADQTITATVSSSSTPWSNTVTVGSTGSSGTGAITFNLDPSSDAVCHLSGTTLSATGAGTCYVSASIAADANYTGATSALVPVTFTAGDQTITATVSSSSTPWSNTVTVGSTGSSGTGAITFNLDPSSDAVCHLSGTTLSATGAGTCYVSASIAADANYTGATSALVPVTFTAADQTITATVSSSSTPWSNTVTVGSTGSSGTGAITFNLDPSSDAVCHLSGTTLSATGAGTCYVSASIAADANYTGATSALVPVTFTAGDQTITATVSSSSTPWSNTVTVGSTGSSGTGAITFNLDPSSDAVCHLSGTTLSATGAGTCYVSASIAADANYTGATSALVPVTFTAADQTITATVSSSSTPWSNTVTVGSTGSSGTGAITFNLDPSSDAVCHLSGTTLSATGAGTCYVSASIAADANYTGATSALVPVTFTAADQTITATVSSSSTPWSNTVTVGSTGSSGTGAITFNLDPSSDAVCHLSGTTLSATGAGTCYVSASIAADANYTGATSALVPVTFTAGDQTITATVSSSSTPWSNTVTVGSTGSSGTGAITFNLDPSSDAVCHLSGTTLSATGAGTCYVSASIAADANYTGATSALVPVTFTAADQTITATVSSSSTPWSNTVTVGSTGSSGTGAITFNLDPSSDAVCHLSGTTLSATGAGTCYVSASIAADANYTGATSALVPVTFTAADQTITFAESGQGSWATTRSKVNGLAKSGTGTVSYFIDTGSNGHTSPSGCAVDPLSGAVSASGAVTCYVYAVIAPDLNYLGATSSDVAVSFTLASQVIYAVPASGMVGTPVVLHATGYTGTGAISFALAGGGTATGCSISSGQMSATSGGTCRFVAMIAPDGNYSGATSTPADITLAAPGNLIVGASSQTMNVGGVVAIAASVTGLLGGDSATVSSVTLTYTGTGGTTYGPSTTAPTAPGTYSVMPSAASVVVTPGADQSLYSTTYAYTPGTLVIVATAKVTVTVSDVAITAGDAVNPVVSVSGLAAGYSATIVYVSGTLVVAPAPVVVVNNPPPAPPTTFTIKSFGEGSFKLTAQLKKQVRALALMVRAGHYKVVTLTGFTDNVFTASLNVVLTQNRAAVVASELKKDLKRLKVGGVTIRIVPGVTITLVTSNTTPQGRAENRRVVATLQAK